MDLVLDEQQAKLLGVAQELAKLDEEQMKQLRLMYGVIKQVKLGNAIVSAIESKGMPELEAPNPTKKKRKYTRSKGKKKTVKFRASEYDDYGDTGFNRIKVSMESEYGPVDDSKLNSRLATLMERYDLKAADFDQCLDTKGLGRKVKEGTADRVSVPMLRQLARTFNLTVDYFLGRGEVADFIDSSNGVLRRHEHLHKAGYYKFAPKGHRHELFAQRLNFMLRYYNMTQGEFVRDVGMASGVVSPHFTGKQEPRFVHFCSYAQYFDISADYLLGAGTEADYFDKVPSED